MTKQQNRWILEVIIVLLIVIASARCGSSKKQGHISEGDIQAVIYNPVTGVIQGVNMNMLIADTLVRSPADPERNIILRDTFYKMGMVAPKMVDSAGKKVPLFKDSAKRIPDYDTTWYTIDKFLIYTGPKDYTKFNGHNNN